MRRAGHGVWLLPWIEGSHEQIPANIPDYARRDRRWSQGSLQLNVQKPVIAVTLLESIELLAAGVASFDERCLRGLEPDRERIAAHLERTLMLVTALTPHIGYDAAAAIAKDAHARGVTLREAALDSGEVDADDFDAWVRPEAMTGPPGSG